MRVFNFKNKFFVFFIFCLILTLGFFAQKLDINNPLPKLTISKQQSAVNIKSDYVNLLFLGHSRLVSSLLWITTLLEADHDHYKGSGNSWLFYRFMTITKLEPLFYSNYFFGGMYLSVIKDDIYGANVLLEKGLDHYPDDFWLNYYAGFNSAFSLGDNEAGLAYFSKIINDPKINKHLAFLPSLYVKMRFQQGQLSLLDTFKALSEILNQTELEAMKARIRSNLYSLKAQIDLECLNDKPKDCDKFDFDGARYLFKEGQWSAAKDWKPYKLYKK